MMSKKGIAPLVLIVVMGIAATGLFMVGKDGLLAITNLGDDRLVYDTFKGEDNVNVNCETINEYYRHGHYDKNTYSSVTTQCSNELWISKTFIELTTRGSQDMKGYNWLVKDGTLQVIGSSYYGSPIEGKPARRSTIQSKKDFKGSNVAFRVDFTPTCSIQKPQSQVFFTHTVGSAKLDIAGIKYDVSLEECAEYQTQGKTTKLYVEARSEGDNPDYIELWINGEPTGKSTVLAPDKPLYVKIITSANTVLHPIKYDMHHACNPGSSDLIGIETIYGPAEINIYSFRKPVKDFCMDAVFEDAEGPTQTSRPYRILTSSDKNGMPNTYTLKAGEKLTSSYVFYNDGSLNIKGCDDQYWDFNNKRCTDLSATVYFCNGQWDAESHACYEVLDQEKRCAGVWEDKNDNGEVDSGECFEYMPEQGICENPEAEVDTTSGKCVIILDTEERKSKDCSMYPGTTYNPQSGYCEAFTLIDCKGQLAEKDGKLVCYNDVDVVPSLPKEPDKEERILSGIWDWFKNIFKNVELI